jgi:hypothetical protein
MHMHAYSHICIPTCTKSRSHTCIHACTQIHTQGEDGDSGSSSDDDAGPPPPNAFNIIAAAFGWTKGMLDGYYKSPELYRIAFVKVPGLLGLGFGQKCGLANFHAYLQTLTMLSATYYLEFVKH